MARVSQSVMSRAKGNKEAKNRVFRREENGVHRTWLPDIQVTLVPTISIVFKGETTVSAALFLLFATQQHSGEHTRIASPRRE